MSEPVVKNSAEYKQLKRKLAWLEWVQSRRGLEPYEEEWLLSVTAQLEIADLAHQLGLTRVTGTGIVTAITVSSDEAKDLDMEIKIEATPGPWEICEFGADHPDALPGEVGVYAPKHPDSYQKEDGTWHGVTICRGMTGPAKRDNATFITCAWELLEVVKLTYRKHHLGDESIGWDELSDKLGDALSNAMGPSGYWEWMHLMESSRDE